MLALFFQQNMFIYVMTGVAVIGLVQKIILGSYYKKMAYASENMGLTNRKPIKTLKTKFENSYKLDMPVNDVEAFVDKNLSKQRLCGISIRSWDRLGGQLTIFCVLIGMFGAFYGVLKDDTVKNILGTFLFGIFTGGFLLLIEASIGTKIKRERMMTNIKDYLDNYLVHRISPEARAEAAAGTVKEEEKKNTREEDIAYLKNCLNEIASARNLEPQPVTEKDEELLEDILRDYFL